MVGQASLIGLHVKMKKNNESTKNGEREKVKMRGGSEWAAAIGKGWRCRPPKRHLKARYAVM